MRIEILTIAKKFLIKLIGRKGGEKTKFYWHIHHGILIEPATEPIKERIRYIKEEKPEEERALRLKLLKPVKGKTA